jgi:hypothetical protein
MASSFAALALTAGFAGAQPPMPYQTPTVSPYLNLLRPGAPTALNYYNLVRPQVEFNNAVQQLQSQVGYNRQALSDLQQGATRTNSTLPATGFIPQFQTQRSYFLTYSGGGMISSGVGGGQIPNRASGGGNPRAMGVPALGSPSTGGIGGMGVGALPR